VARLEKKPGGLAARRETLALRFFGFSRTAFFIADVPEL